MSAWNRKDYDTFQISIQSLLSIIKNVKNWPTIEYIRSRMEEIETIVIKDPRATNIILDSIKNILPLLLENKKNYPARELLWDYRDFSYFIISDGLSVSILHSLTNYREIGITMVEKNKEKLLFNLFDDFMDIYEKAKNRNLQKRSPALMTFSALGIAAAKSGLKKTLIKFLQYLVEYDFTAILNFPFRTLDIIKKESKKRNWKNIYTFCEELEKSFHESKGENAKILNLLTLLDE